MKAKADIMVLSLIAALIIGFLSIIVPGFLLSLALLRRTHLHIVEISLIGFIFGFIAPALLTWLEAYLIPYVHFFSFSLALFGLNILIMTIIGFVLCLWRGAFKNFRADYFPKKGTALSDHHQKIKKSHAWVWALLLIIMLSVFLTRIQSIPTAPTFFEFDPYFDMIDTQSILTLGQQMLFDPSAWPVVPGGTNHRIEPLIPYIEAYWYDLSNAIGPHFSSFNINMMADVASYYPPITAALLVFVIFMLLYHEYNEHIALIGAALTALMPVLYTTFIAGEQLVESWGIFALFFFLAAYMLATKHPKSKTLAIFAGVAFATNFFGAHYYTVTVGVFVAYLLLQGVIDVIRGDVSKDFYKMNAIVITVIVISLALFLPYSSTLQNRIPSTFGIPITISWPILALLGVAVMDYVPKFLQKNKMLFNELTTKTRSIFVAVVIIVGLVLVLATPIGSSVQKYITLSTHFTTPSVPLFMTVEEYIPTGPMYDYGAAGFGMLGDSIGGIPVLIYVISAISIVLIALSIVFRKNRPESFTLPWLCP